jgi:Kdo2-lipid IVA lauroyltransferase/acyltransferase
MTEAKEVKQHYEAGEAVSEPARSRARKERYRQISFWQRLAFLLEAIFVIPLATVISCLPWNMARALGRLCGLAAFYFDRRDKRQACYNLDVIYADNPLSEGEKHRIVKRLFINVGIGAFEYLKIGDLQAENCEDFVHIGDYSPLVRAIEEGKGVLAVTAHLGNWEYLGSVVAKMGLNVGAVIKRQHNPYTDRWLTDFREKKGKVKCFYNESSVVVHIASHLRRNGILAFLADQREISKPILVPFFGVPCGTYDGPAKLHIWYEAPIVFASAARQNDGKYLLSVEGPYHFERSGNLDHDCRRIMTWVNSQYEEMIRKYPDQWFSLLTPRWGHVRTF